MLRCWDICQIGHFGWTRMADNRYRLFGFLDNGAAKESNCPAVFQIENDAFGRAGQNNLTVIPVLVTGIQSPKSLGEESLLT